MITQLEKKVEENEFELAMREWLSGEVSGHLGPHMYTDDRDDFRWKEGHSSESYYLGHDDKLSFDLMLKELDIRVESFFDLGPGGDAAVLAKSLPIMRMLKAKNYFPVDLSLVLANAALTTIKSRLNVTGTPIITDFFKHIPYNEDNALIALMGGTIGNIETYKALNELRDRLTQIFFSYRNVLNKKGFFLISFDANSNSKEILACYENPQIHELIRSCVERAINTSGFDYRAVWTPQNFQLAMGLKANRDQIIHFGGEQFAIEKGEFLPVLNSYRFPVDFVREAAAEAGWKHKKTWSKTGRVHYLLFE